MLILNQLLHEDEKQLGFVLIDDPVTGQVHLLKDKEYTGITFPAKTVEIKEIHDTITSLVHLGIVFGKN